MVDFLDLSLYATNFAGYLSSERLFTSVQFIQTSRLKKAL